MALDEYFTSELPPEKIINVLLGDLQCIWIYARRGWSAPQRIPVEVLQACESLVALGFTKHLMRTSNSAGRQPGCRAESDKLRALWSFASSSHATSAFVLAKRRKPASRIAESGTLLKGV
jgi:hypothetical protein